MPSRRTFRAQIIFSESGRGLGHVTTTIFDSTVGYPTHKVRFGFGSIPILATAWLLVTVVCICQHNDCHTGWAQKSKPQSFVHICAKY